MKNFLDENRQIRRFLTISIRALAEIIRCPINYDNQNLIDTIRIFWFVYFQSEIFSPYFIVRITWWQISQDLLFKGLVWCRFLTHILVSRIPSISIATPTWSSLPKSLPKRTGFTSTTSAYDILFTGSFACLWACYELPARALPRSFRYSSYFAYV